MHVFFFMNMHVLIILLCPLFSLPNSYFHICFSLTVRVITTASIIHHNEAEYLASLEDASCCC